MRLFVRLISRSKGGSTPLVLADITVVPPVVILLAIMLSIPDLTFRLPAQFQSDGAGPG